MPDDIIEKEVAENEIDETEIDDVEPGDDFDFPEDFDIFAEEETPAEIPEVVVEKEAVVEETQTDEEKAAAQKAAEEAAAAKPDDAEEKDPVKIIAALNKTLATERQKKQEAREELKTFQQQSQKPAEKKKFDWEDPDSTLADIDRTIDQKVLSVKLNMSAAQAKIRYDDYQDTVDAFAVLTKTDQSLIDKMVEQPDPAEWLYKYTKKQESLKEIGEDPTAYKANLKETLKAEILAELKADGLETKIVKAATKIPPSAANIKGKTVKADEVVLDDDPLAKVFGDR